MRPIRVLIADDHALVRAGIRALVEKIEGVVVVGEAGKGSEALELVEEHRPDLMLLDLRSGDATALLDEAVVEARYAAGHLVYVLGNGSLLAAPFDLRTHRLTAPPVTLATGVTLTGSGQAQFSVASNGTQSHSTCSCCVAGISCSLPRYHSN